MGFGSKESKKRQLGTWHGRAYGSTGRAILLEKQQKGLQSSSTVVPVAARPCQPSSVGIGFETLTAWIFLHHIFIFSAPNIILDPFLLESSLKPFL